MRGREGNPGNKKSHRPQSKVEGRKRGEEDLRKQRKTGQRVKTPTLSHSFYFSTFNPRPPIPVSVAFRSDRSIFFWFLLQYIENKSTLNVLRGLMKCAEMGVKILKRSHVNGKETNFLWEGNVEIKQ